MNVIHVTNSAQGQQNILGAGCFCKKDTSISLEIFLYPAPAQDHYIIHFLI